MNRYSVSEIAAKLGVEKEAARGLVLFLVAAELAEYRGERRSSMATGRGEKVYSLVDGFEKALAAKLRRAAF